MHYRFRSLHFGGCCAGLLALLLALALPARAQTPPAQDPPAFQFVVNVADAANDLDLVLATDPGASQGTDGLDRLAPPAAPGGFDARLSNAGIDYFDDYRPAGFGTFSYTVEFATDPGDGPIVLSWDPNALPDGVNAVLTDAILGTFTQDMRETSSLDVSTSSLISNAGKAVVELTVVAPPAAPTSLGAAPASSTEIDLSWADNATDETRVEIERSTDGGSTYDALTVLGADATSFTDTGLAPNTAYSYRVRAANEAGASAYSNEASATTPKAALDFAPAALSFAAQAGAPVADQTVALTAEVDPPSPVALAAVDDATGQAPTWLTVPASASAGTDVTIGADADGLSDGTYTATVTASAADYTDAALAVTLVVSSLEAPTSPAAAALSASAIEVSWTDNAADEDGFEVERSTDGGSTFALLATKGADAAVHVDDGLAPGTEFCYRVRAFNANGPSGYSPVACATTNTATLSPTPTSLSFSIIAGGQSASDGFVVASDGVGTPGLTLAAVDDATGQAPTWLSVPATGALGETLAVEADPSGLDEGTYTATISVSAGADGYASATVGVVLTVTPPVEVDWTGTLAVEDANGYGMDLVFGTGPDATDAADPGYDRSAPPKPPSGSFDARLLHDGTAFFADYRQTVSTTVTWTVEVTPSAGSESFTLDWGASQLPAEGRFTLRDVINGSLVDVDMREQSSLTVTNTAIDEFEIVYSLTSLFGQSGSAGWNLLALPVDALDKDYQAVYPDLEPAQLPYRYAGAYSRTSALENGVGYWIEFLQTGTQTVEGYDLSAVTIDLVDGWNTIGGSLACSVPLSSVEDPGGILVPGTLYGYDRGYEIASTIEQGRGYWIEASGAGQITLACASGGAAATAASATAASARSAAPALDVLTVRDAAGNAQDLVLAGRADGAQSYALPPLPPRGAFDARFEGDLRRMDAAEGQVLLRGVQGALSLGLASPRADARYQVELRDARGRVLGTETLRAGEPVATRAEGVAALVVRRASALPDAFALQGTSPNPTRGAATLRFDLPEQAEVEVEVFDMLGRSVLSVPAHPVAAGARRSLPLSTDRLTAGLYLYRVKVQTAGGRVQVAKGRLTVVR
jgi:hypothetical protein